MLQSRFIDGLRQRAQGLGRTVAFPESSDSRVLEAARILFGMGVAREIWLWGNADEVIAKASSSNIDLEPWRHCLRFVSDDVRLKEQLRELRSGQLTAKGQVPLASALEAFAEGPLNQAGWLLHEGVVDAVVAGSVATTADVIRAALATVGLAPGLKTVSGAFLLCREAKDGTCVNYLFGDSAVIIEPSIVQLVDIGAVLAQTFDALELGDQPRVAFLSFSTRGSAHHPRQERMASAAESFRTCYPDIAADGEMQFDAAISPEVAARKCPDSRIAGQANCFVFPDLDSGNISYKIAQRLGGFQAYGPLLLGLRKPFCDLSRGASAEEIAVTAMINMVRA